jgi:flagellar biosynthesis/type III secretory pathway protein FliH
MRRWPEGTPQAWQPAVIDLRPRVAAGPEEPDAAERAYALGFQEGRAEGEAAERARLAPAVRAAEEAIRAINDADAHWTGAVEENLVALSIAIARHLVDREIAEDPEVVERLIRRALEAFPLDQPVQLRVHPDDLALLRELRNERPTAMLGRQEADTTWVADARVSRGGCLVEGRERIIDGRIETALERIFRRLVHHHD